MIQKYCVKHSSRKSTLERNMKSENSSYISTENTEEIDYQNENVDANIAPQNVTIPPQVPVKPERTKSQTFHENDFTKIDDQSINKRSTLPRILPLSHDSVETYRAPEAHGSNNKVHSPEIIQRKILLQFMTTFEGALYICEILGSVLCWILLVIWSYAEATYRMPHLLGVSMFIFVTSWIATSLIFLVLLLGADSKINWMVILRHDKFGLTYHLCWAILYVVAGGISASYAVHDFTQVLGAATAIGFIVFVIHFSHFLTSFYKLYKKSPCAYLATCTIVCEP